MHGFDGVFWDEKVLNVVYLSLCPKAHQTYLTAYFQCFLGFFPLVLLCHFQQQVLQRYCSAVSTDNGEYENSGHTPVHFCMHTSCVFKHKTVSLCAALLAPEAKAVTAVPVLACRECTLCHQCCWSAWACLRNTAPSSQRSWESSSSTSTTAGSMWYS